MKINQKREHWGCIISDYDTIVFYDTIILMWASFRLHGPPTADGFVDPDQVNHHNGLAGHQFVLLLKRGSLGIQYVRDREM